MFIALLPVAASSWERNNKRSCGKGATRLARSGLLGAAVQRYFNSFAKGFLGKKVWWPEKTMGPWGFRLLLVVLVAPKLRQKGPRNWCSNKEPPTNKASLTSFPSQKMRMNENFGKGSRTRAHSRSRCSWKSCPMHVLQRLHTKNVE